MLFKRLVIFFVRNTSILIISVISHNCFCPIKFSVYVLNGIHYYDLCHSFCCMLFDKNTGKPKHLLHFNNREMCPIEKNRQKPIFGWGGEEKMHKMMMMNGFVDVAVGEKLVMNKSRKMKQENPIQCSMSIGMFSINSVPKWNKIK